MRRAGRFLRIHRVSRQSRPHKKIAMLGPAVVVGGLCSPGAGGVARRAWLTAGRCSGTGFESRGASPGPLWSRREVWGDWTVLRGRGGGVEGRGRESDGTGEGEGAGARRDAVRADGAG